MRPNSSRYCSWLRLHFLSKNECNTPSKRPGGLPSTAFPNILATRPPAQAYPFVARKVLRNDSSSASALLRDLLLIRDAAGAGGGAADAEVGVVWWGGRRVRVRLRLGDRGGCIHD